MFFFVQNQSFFSPPIVASNLTHGFFPKGENSNGNPKGRPIFRICDPKKVRDLDTELQIIEGLKILVRKVYAEENNCLPNNIRDSLQTSMIDLSKFSILYGCKIEDCATGDMFTHEISLSKYALDESSCGCLEATLLHEFFHTTGTLPVLSPEDEGNERKASACELKCFPDCALVDKDISPEECCDDKI